MSQCATFMQKSSRIDSNAAQSYSTVCSRQLFRQRRQKLPSARSWPPAPFSLDTKVCAPNKQRRAPKYLIDNAFLASSQPFRDQHNGTSGSFTPWHQISRVRLRTNGTPWEMTT